MNEVVKEDTQYAQKMELFSQIMEHGYTAKEAMDLVTFKFSTDCEFTQSLKEKFKIAKMIPIRYVSDWDKLDNEARMKKLWDLGFNTRTFNYAEDVCCYTWNDKRECGRVVWGQERTDKEYLNLVVDGHHIASIEARYAKDKDVLETLRGNTRAW